MACQYPVLSWPGNKFLDCVFGESNTRNTKRHYREVWSNRLVVHCGYGKVNALQRSRLNQELLVVS